MRILFAASEAYPLIKTGGLADVAGSLSRALVNAGEELRLVLPAYGDIKSSLGRSKNLLQTQVDGQPVGLLQTTLPGSRVGVWLVDCPPLFDRPGNPYVDAEGQPWPDNDRRFALFCRVIVLLARDQLGLGWQPEVVHLNDWQTGLVPVWLRQLRKRPATVFTIHNLAYQGIFDHESFTSLGLEPSLWHYRALEFYGDYAFIKGALVYADRITTVSPSYAREIQGPEFGEGLDGLLSERADVLSGILNGIDTRDWNPATDPHLSQNYTRQHLERRAANKLALQLEFGLPEDEGVLLLGLVGRLVTQKGIDLILEALPKIMAMDVQLVILGSGDPVLEKQLKRAMADYPDRLALSIGYSEPLAHRVEAGCDCFLMPSRFEPCGLNQMYSQRYGALPIVTSVGGLRDTVVDADDTTLTNRTATGFVMPTLDGAGLLSALVRVVALFGQTDTWRQLQRNAMAQDFGWGGSAQAYRDLYAQAWASVRKGAPK